MPKNKPVKIKPTPEATHKLLSVLSRRYHTIREFAEELFQLEHYKDNGRSIGYDYGWIRAKILRKFPVVTLNGPHKGQPTKIAFKELQAIVSGLNRAGVKLPFRPRRKMQIAKKKQSS